MIILLRERGEEVEMCTALNEQTGPSKCLWENLNKTGVSIFNWVILHPEERCKFKLILFSNFGLPYNTLCFLHFYFVFVRSFYRRTSTLEWAKYLWTAAYKEPWGYYVNFLLGMCRWDTVTLTLWSAYCDQLVILQLYSRTGTKITPTLS